MQKVKAPMKIRATVTAALLYVVSCTSCFKIGAFGPSPLDCTPPESLFSCEFALMCALPACGHSDETEQICATDWGNAVDKIRDKYPGRIIAIGCLPGATAPGEVPQGGPGLGGAGGANPVTVGSGGGGTCCGAAGAGPGNGGSVGDGVGGSSDVGGVGPVSAGAGGFVAASSSDSVADVGAGAGSSWHGHGGAGYAW